jgi:hypothetical protein
VPLPEPDPLDLHPHLLSADDEFHRASPELFERRVVRTFAQSMQAMHDIVAAAGKEPRTDCRPGGRLSAASLTGIDVGAQLMPNDGSRTGLVVFMIGAAKEILKMGGLHDQAQTAGGERYQQIVTPPPERLTAAATAVQLEESSQLEKAAAKFLESAGALAANAEAGSREYKRAESGFERAIKNFQRAK